MDKKQLATRSQIYSKVDYFTLQNSFLKKRSCCFLPSHVLFCLTSLAFFVRKGEPNRRTE